MKNDIPKNYVVKIGHENNLYLEFKTKLSVSVPKSSYSKCRKLLEGKAIYLGKYHLKNSKFNLIGSRSAYKPRLSKISKNKETSVYMYWLKGKKTPFLLDNLESSIILHTPMYKASIKKKSFYYVSFKPVLNYATLNKRHIKIPLIPLVH